VALLWSGWYAVSTGGGVIHEKGKPAIVAYAGGPHASEFKSEVRVRLVVWFVLALFGGGAFCSLFAASSERKAKAIAEEEERWQWQRRSGVLLRWFIVAIIVGVVAILLYAAAHGT
jgi:hypothetical protein